MLRTTIVLRDDEPAQEIHGYQEVAFTTAPVGPLTDAALPEEVTTAYALPFDLEQGPLFRVHLFTHHPMDHLLLLTMHHIVSDGWSVWMLLEELSTLYQADPVCL
jgi:hypothetical protein